MPIDSNLLNSIANPTPVKLENPLEQYGNYLRASALQGDIRKAKDAENQNALARAAYKSAVRADGTVDRTKRNTFLAENDAGTLLPDELKNDATIDKTVAETDKARVEGLKSEAEGLGKLVDTSLKSIRGTSADPVAGLPQRIAQITAEHQHPTYVALMGNDANRIQQSFKDDADKAAQAAKSPATWAAYLADTKGTLEEHNRVLLNQATEKRLAAEKHFENTNLGGHQVLSETNKDGTGHRIISDTPITASPNSTRITVNTGTKAADSYATKAGELKAIKDDEMASMAEDAASRIDDFGRARALLDTAITGAGAEVKVKALSLAKMAGQNINNDSLVATQELINFMSTSMLENIAALRNAGVKLGAVTEKEFDQLRATIPKITDDKATIARWIDRAEKASRKVIERYNTRQQRVDNNPATHPTIRNLSSDPVSVAPVQPRAHSSEAGYAKNVALLRKDHSPAAQAEFDAHYGAGASQAIIGGTQPGNRPLAQNGRQTP